MPDRSLAVRLLFGGAALFASVAGTAACSSSSNRQSLNGSTTTTAAIVTPTSAAVLAADGAASSTTVDVAATAATTATAPAVDGNAVLQAALAALDAGYHFTTTVSVDGAPVLVADGDHVGDGTRLGVVRNDVAVQYIITPAGTWVMPDGGDWQQLDSPAATTDPIVALRTPSAVAVDSVNGTVSNLSVTVASNTLGLSGAAPVVVNLTIDGTTLQIITYATTVDTKPATVVATIGPVVDGSPVVAPA